MGDLNSGFSQCAATGLPKPGEIKEKRKEDGADEIGHVYNAPPGQHLSIGAKMINARVETVAAKPSFREAFKKRRCLIPADGFYEWKGPKGDKQPVYITLPGGAPFAFAGLWESWTDRGRLETPYLSCTIITRPAQGPLQAIHHRMPAVLHPDDYAAWLDTANVDTAGLSEMLTQRSIVELVFQPVSRRVNATRNNGPDNIKPVQRRLDF